MAAQKMHGVPASPSLTHRRRRVEVFCAAVEILFELLLVAHAEALEVRLAALKEGAHALVAFLRAPYVGEQLHAVLPGGVEQIRLEIEALLGHAQRLRAVALDGLAPHKRLFQQFRLRYAFVDEADLRRLLRGETARAEDHLAREALADDTRQVLRRADGRARADFLAGLAEHGIL